MDGPCRQLLPRGGREQDCRLRDWASGGHCGLGNCRDLGAVRVLNVAGVELVDVVYRARVANEVAVVVRDGSVVDVGDVHVGDVHLACVVKAGVVPGYVGFADTERKPCGDSNAVADGDVGATDPGDEGGRVDWRNRRGPGTHPQRPR